MIEYSLRSWFSIIFDIYTQHVVRVMFPLLSFICGFSLVSTFLVRHFEVSNSFENVGLFHSFLGIVLGLFLVLRTNTAYDRWWEGRKIWGYLVNDTRSFSLKLAIFLPDEKDKHFFSYMIPNFVFAMKEHLRKGTKMEELHFDSEDHKQHVERAKHKPNIIALYIYDRLQSIYKKGDITGEQLFILDKEAKAFLDHVGACERIKKTPIPYSYNMYIKKFIFIYSLTLPFAFIPHVGYWSALLVSLIFYILVSIALIAEEIEDPFGLDTNDLPLQHISISIKTNVEEIFNEASALRL